VPGRPERPVQGQIGWLIPRSEVTIYHGGHLDLITGTGQLADLVTGTGWLADLVTGTGWLADLITGTGRLADLITGTGRLAPVMDAFLTAEAGEPQLCAGIHGATSQRGALADPSL
jgi:hypothetical protein